MEKAIGVIRRAQGKTRKECALAIGVDPHTWKRWELGLLIPRTRNLYAAAQTLGVPVEALNDFVKDAA